MFNGESGFSDMGYCDMSCGKLGRPLELLPMPSLLVEAIMFGKSLAVLVKSRGRFMSVKDGEKECRFGLNGWELRSPEKAGVKIFWGVGAMLDWGVAGAVRFCGT